MRVQSRYDKGGADYGECAIRRIPISIRSTGNEGAQVNAKSFESAKFFEGCLPIEVMVSRTLTLAHGPLKPVD